MITKRKIHFHTMTPKILPDLSTVAVQHWCTYTAAYSTL